MSETATAKALESDAPLTASVHQRDVAKETAEDAGWDRAALVGRTATIDREEQDAGGDRRGNAGERAGRTAPQDGRAGHGAALTPKPIATIGYEGATLANLIERLTEAGVDLVIDVRAVAASRRPGFSKTILAASLAEAGIAYRHLRDLGTPKRGREAARAGRTAEMRVIYAAHLEEPAAVAQLAQVAELASTSAVALLCYEAEARHCHREIIAERICAETRQPRIDL